MKTPHIRRFAHTTKSSYIGHFAHTMKSSHIGRFAHTTKSSHIGHFAHTMKTPHIRRFAHTTKSSRIRRLKRVRGYLHDFSMCSVLIARPRESGHAGNLRDCPAEKNRCDRKILTKTILSSAHLL